MENFDMISETVELIITQRGLDKASREELLDHIAGDLNGRMNVDLAQLIYDNLSDENKVIYFNLVNDDKQIEARDFAMNNCPGIVKLFRVVTEKYLELYY